MDESPNQPGQVIAPQSAEQPPAPAGGAPAPERPLEEPEPTPAPQPGPEPTNPPADAAEATPARTPDTSAATPEPQKAQSPWQFRQETETTPRTDSLPPGKELTWTASEFIAHEKSFGWYVALAVVTILVAVAIWFITSHDKVSTGVVIFVAIVFGIFAARKPQTRQYSLSRDGLRISDKLYGFQGFKSFAVAEEGAIVSIVFMPLKRFMPSLTIYVAPDLEDKVVDALSDRLPMEPHRQDAIDGFLKRIRF